MLNKLLSQKTLLIGLFLLIAIAFIAPTVYSSVDGPQFNYMEDDLETLVAGNYTQESDWGDPIEAQPGDVISFQLYYHNGVENTTAENTRVRADLPDVASDRLTVNGFIWADNADVVTDSAVVSLEQEQNIEYIPGSTKWFPDRSQEGQSMPDGITGPNGLNIGDITGCWRYAGFVTFRARLTTPPEANLVRSKSAFNLTQDVDATSTVAQPNDLIEYNLTVENQGDAAGSIVIADDITNVLEYSELTNRYGGTLDNTNTIFWPEDNVQPGESVSRRIRVRILPDLPANHTYYLENVYGNEVRVPTRRNITINPNMGLIKRVRNISAGQDSFVNSNHARAGDTLEYLIKVNNQGDIELENNTVVDQLPAQVNFIPDSVKYSYNQNPVDNPASDSLVSDGTNFGELFVNSRLNITLRARVKSNLEPGNYQLVNQASNQAEFNSEVGDGTLSGQGSATTYVNVEEPAEPLTPNLTISKKVRNIETKSNWSNLTTAFSGDRVEYRVIIENTGQTDLEDLKAVDVLPANTNLIEDSVRLIKDGQTSRLPDDIAKRYVNLPTLKVDNLLTIKLKAKTDKDLAADSLLVNIARAKNNEIVKSDQAKVEITPRPKPEVKPAIKGPMPETGTAGNLLIALSVLVVGYGIYRLRVI